MPLTGPEYVSENPRKKFKAAASSEFEAHAAEAGAEFDDDDYTTENLLDFPAFKTRKPAEMTDAEKQRLIAEDPEKWGEYEEFMNENTVYSVEMDVEGEKRRVVFFKQDGEAYSLESGENVWGYQREYNYQNIQAGNGPIKSWRSKAEGDTFVPIEKVDAKGMGNPQAWKQVPIEAGIKGGDFIGPVDVEPSGNGSYKLVNGRNRYEVAMRLGLTHLPIKSIK